MLVSALRFVTRTDVITLTRFCPAAGAIDYVDVVEKRETEMVGGKQRRKGKRRESKQWGINVLCIGMSPYIVLRSFLASSFIHSF